LDLGLLVACGPKALSAIAFEPPRSGRIVSDGDTDETPIRREMRFSPIDSMRWIFHFSVYVSECLTLSHRHNPEGRKTTPKAANFAEFEGNPKLDEAEKAPYLIFHGGHP
jgi:hypothetical protein